MDSKQKGNLAIASAIKHFAEIAGQTTVNVGRESKWSKWEQYVLPSTGDNCSPTEESVGEHSSNSVKPLEGGNAEPNPERGRCRDLMGSIQDG